MAKAVSDWLTECQAAEIVGLSERTLQRMRLAGESPFIIWKPRGRVRYSRKNVLAWVESQMVLPGAGAGGK